MPPKLTPSDNLRGKGANTRKVTSKMEETEGSVDAERQQETTNTESEIRGQRRATLSFKSIRKKGELPESDCNGRRRPRRPHAADAADDPNGVALVRETRTSKLRAATRVSALEPYSPSYKCAAANANSKPSAPASTAKTRLKKFLTSDGIYGEDHEPGTAEIRRQSFKFLKSGSFSPKAHCEKSILSQYGICAKSNSPKKDSKSSFVGRGQIRGKISQGCSANKNTAKGSGPGEIVTNTSLAGSSACKITQKKTDDAIKELFKLRKARNMKSDDVVPAEPKSAVRLKETKSPNPKESRTTGARFRGRERTGPAGKNVPSNASRMNDMLDRNAGSASLQEQSSKPSKTSILTGKLEFAASVEHGAEPPKSKPTSILKRKPVPQEENTQANYLPVTFSPSILEKENDQKRQGILKKRRSLDECDVLDKQGGSLDSKPILKNQRRGSAQELTRRTQSLDSAFPQGILKRKSSREEEAEDLSGNAGLPFEPHGILKKKPPVVSQPVLQRRPVVDREGAVSASAVEQPPENVRPILKKKILSEEFSSWQHPLPEVPKSILKKKMSLDGDETDERPKKPILKSTKSSSAEEPDNLVRTDLPRPILKREPGTGRWTDPGPFLAFGGLFQLRVRPGRRSFSYAEGELSASFSNRSSSSQGSLDLDIFEREQLKRSSSNDSLREQVPRTSWNFDRDKAPIQERFIQADSPPTSPPLHSLQLPDLDACRLTAPNLTMGEKKRIKRRSEFPGGSCLASQEILPAVADAVPTSDESFPSYTGSMRLDGSVDTDLIELPQTGRKLAATLKFEVMATGKKEIDLGRENKTGRRRKEKKNVESSFKRFHTQPVFRADDLELVQRKVKIPPPPVAPTQSDDGQHEDEFSSMSYSERVRLFESVLSPRNQESTHGCRVSRFCTQPVTSMELEVAKSLKQCRDAANGNQKAQDNPDEENIFLNPQSKRQGKSPLTLELRNVLRQAGGKRSIDRSNIDPKRLDPKGHFPVSSPSSGETTAIWVSELLDPAVGFSRSRNNSTIVKSQSHSAVSSSVHSTQRSETAGGLTEDAEEDAKSHILRKSGTQPFELSEGSPDGEDMTGATIQERLARLKKSGELGWQKRKRDATNSENPNLVTSRGSYLSAEQEIRSSARGSAPPSEEGQPSRRLVLADRLIQLDAASQGWKKRIQPSDAIRFSVEGKMGVRNAGTTSSHSGSLAKQERLKRSPKARIFSSKDPLLYVTEAPSPATLRGEDHSSSSCPLSGASDITQWSIVSVPKTDDETFTSFYGGLERIQIPDDPLEIKDEDLNAVALMKSSQLLVQKKDVKRQRRRATARNPVKSLAARLDSQEYVDVMTRVARVELGRMKWGKDDRSTSLAMEALAGLASREDFTSVTLKKTAEGSVTFPDAPYKDLMLLQVKGRRHVQTRLVEPVAASVNAGDCFILVTGNRVFHYVGKFANVIERCRGAEISSHIQQKGDLGCSAESVITLGDASKATKAQIDEFWKLLGGEAGCEREAGDPDEDELFEASLMDTNMVYEVVGTQLVPNETCWGTTPRMEILDPNKIFVFDFGSEFYVWNGKNASLANRRLAIRLGKELWKEGYNYLECSLCPITVASFAGSRRGELKIPDCAKTGSTRPPWTLFAKITQNMETVLFREKFLDWPAISKIIKKNRKGIELEGGGGGNDEGGEDEDVNEDEYSDDDDDGKVKVGRSSRLKACDPKEMLETVVPLPDLVLEGTHLGRGLRYYDQETRRCSEIATRDVTVWHINEFEYSKVSPASVGQFHMGDSYVVRWYYTVTVTGRELSGQPSKHQSTGRDRYAYFCWQGQNSPINDRGAAACLTVELDKENGPQVRVCQGSEPPAFLNLFQGRMVVHEGKRAATSPSRSWRLFFSRGETESESVLFEVPCSGTNLRSAASFVLVNAIKGRVVVWHGSNSSQLQRTVAVTAAEKIQRQMPEEFGFSSTPVSATEVDEGDEPEEISRVLGPRPPRGTGSDVIGTPRLFCLSSVSGDFHASEVASPYLGADSPTPFPFQQSDLYSASQPALFLLDAGPTLWLWQGWWEDNSESDRGSGNVRFRAERRAAVSTAIAYWNEKHGANTRPKIYSVWAGLEPALFTNLFPFWTDRDDVATINVKEGKKPGDMAPVNGELDNLTRSFYPLSQLQHRPLPDGVNPNSLEEYLNPQCFQDLFGIERKEFLKLPSWKKKKLKQKFGLF